MPIPSNDDKDSSYIKQRCDNWGGKDSNGTTLHGSVEELFFPFGLTLEDLKLFAWHLRLASACPEYKKDFDEKFVDKYNKDKHTGQTKVKIIQGKGLGLVTTRSVPVGTSLCHCVYQQLPQESYDDMCNWNPLDYEFKYKNAKVMDMVYQLLKGQMWYIPNCKQPDDGCAKIQRVFECKYHDKDRTPIVVTTFYACGSVIPPETEVVYVYGDIWDENAKLNGEHENDPIPTKQIDHAYNEWKTREGIEAAAIKARKEAIKNGMKLERDENANKPRVRKKQKLAEPTNPQTNGMQPTIPFTQQKTPTKGIQYTKEQKEMFGAIRERVRPMVEQIQDHCRIVGLLESEVSFDK